MKFQTQIIGMPIYLLVTKQPPPKQPTSEFPQLIPTSSAVYDNYKIWLTLTANIVTKNQPYNVIDVTSYSKEAAVFTVDIKNSVKNGGLTMHEAEITIGDKYLVLKEYGLTLVSDKNTITLITSCGEIINGGNFVFAANDVFAIVTKDTSQRPILGSTKNKAQASAFYFSWKSMNISKDLMRLYLRARYYLDHPTFLSFQDQREDIKKIYDELGNAIIGQAIGGNRIENVYYDSFSNNLKTVDIARLDDWRHPAIDYNNNEHNYENMDVDNSIQAGLNIDQKLDKSTPAYQRAITNETSQSAVDMYYQDTLYQGIQKNADHILNQAGVQPSAWDKIEKIVEPLGKSTNVWPAPLILENNVLGLNFHHPVIMGAGNSPIPLFLKRDGDYDLNMGRGLAVFIISQDITSITDTPDMEEKECPFGDAPREGFMGVKNSNIMWLLVLIIFIAILSKAYRNYSNRRLQPEIVKVGE